MTSGAATVTIPFRLPGSRGPQGGGVAVDKDKGALKKLARRGRAAGLANIESVFLPAERTLPLEDGLTEGCILTFRNGASGVNAIRLPE